MGRVWLAVDERHGGPVAMKECVPPGGLTAAERALVTRWAPREARAFAGLDDGGLLTYGQLAVGVGLFAWSFRFDKKRAARRRAVAGTSRRERWTQALVGGGNPGQQDDLPDTWPFGL